MSPLALSVRDAAEAIGISRSALYKLIAAGEVRVVRFGRRTVVPVDELQRLLKARLDDCIAAGGRA